MKNEILTVIYNKPLNSSVYEMKLTGKNCLHKSGQFLEIALPTFSLRRPFSIADCDTDTITLLYKVVGDGTKSMTKAQNGDKFDCLLDLGNGFSVEMSKKPLLIGGGIGVAPLYYLAKKFAEKGIRPKAVLGFRCDNEIFYFEKFKEIADMTVTTDDGSFGIQGNTVDILKQGNLDFDYYYACGPLVMLKALQKFSVTGELSLEARMGCGFGVCMGCSIQTVDGAKRVCKDGAIFPAEKLIF